MKILSISDIHNNAACVRKLRAQESNDYDVIAIPGDIGTYGAAEIFETCKRRSNNPSLKRPGMPVAPE